mgnify:CR=1 FL=1
MNMIMSSKGKSVHNEIQISMHTCRSRMSAASQGAFVVIPEISHSDISGIKKTGASLPDARTAPVFSSNCFFPFPAVQEPKQQTAFDEDGSGCHIRQLDDDISQCSCFHRSGKHSSAGAVRVHTAKKLRLDTAAQHMQGGKFSSRELAKLFQSHIGLQGQTFVNASDHLSDCLRYRLIGPAAKRPDPFRDISRGCEFRCGRGNKTSKRCRLLCQLFTLTIGICCSLPPHLAASILNEPSTANII